MYDSSDNAMKEKVDAHHETDDDEHPFTRGNVQGTCHEKEEGQQPSLDRASYLPGIYADRAARVDRPRHMGRKRGMRRRMSHSHCLAE